MKKILLFTVIAAILAVPAFSNVISFYIVETGLPLSDGAGHRSSVLWENAFLDVFFDAGYIVTNYPMMRFGEKPDGSIIQAAGFDLAEAMEAGIDYILIAQLDYSDPLKGPDNVSICVFKVTSHLVVYEKKIPGADYRNERDALLELRKIIRELVPVISMI